MKTTGAPSQDRFHVAGADLTAFAHGELPEWRRAEISRHVLGCPACHDALARSRDVLALLGEAGRFGIESLRADVAARRRPFAARAVRAVATAASVAAVVALGVVLAPPRGPAASPASPSIATAAEPSLTPDQRALVVAQRADGRWAAETALGGAKRDESATALALLALLPRDADGLRSGPAAHAVAEGLRWLRSRRGAANEVRAADEGDAVATCALLEVFALTGDARLKSGLDREVRRIAQAYPDGLDDVVVTPALGWSLRALTRASALGWRHLEAPVRRIREAGSSLDDSLAGLARVAVVPADADAPCALALRVLRERHGS